MFDDWPTEPNARVRCFLYVLVGQRGAVDRLQHERAQHAVALGQVGVLHDGLQGQHRQQHWIDRVMNTETYPVEWIDRFGWRW